MLFWIITRFALDADSLQSCEKVDGTNIAVKPVIIEKFHCNRNHFSENDIFHIVVRILSFLSHWPSLEPILQELVAASSALFVAFVDPIVHETTKWLDVSLA